MTHETPHDVSASRHGLLDDLHRYGDWANGKIFALCEGLDHAALDQPRDLGPGSLRKTLFHLLMSETVWLDRWTGAAQPTYSADPNGASVRAIADRMRDVASRRAAFLDVERANGFRRIVAYRNIAGEAHERRLDDLLIHLFNHGIHHRAQCLAYLKSCGRAVPVGIDYLFFRLAQPLTPQSEAARAMLSSFGLELGTELSAPPAWNASWIGRWFAYGDAWTSRLFDEAAALSPAELDRDFNMGPGSLRKTLQHLTRAEQWWLRNWTEGPSPFPPSPVDQSIDELRAAWTDATTRRNAYLKTVDEAKALSVVSGELPGGLTVQYRVLESLTQLCGHGTHHRAQVVNMLKQSGRPLPATDFVVWAKDHPPS